MPAQSGVLPARNRWLPEHGERRRSSSHAAHTRRWLSDGDPRLDRVACAANAGATSLRTTGDSDTTAAHRPEEAERDWPLPAAQASPAPLARLSRPHRATHRAAPVWRSGAESVARLRVDGSALPGSG